MSKANDKQIGGDHYKGDMQHWDFTRKHNYNQFQYCITKYTHRYMDKNGLQDIEKAAHHMEKYIETYTWKDALKSLYSRPYKPAQDFAEVNGYNGFQLCVLCSVHGNPTKAALLIGYDALLKKIEEIEFHEEMKQMSRGYVNQ